MKKLKFSSIFGEEISPYDIAEMRANIANLSEADTFNLQLGFVPFCDGRHSLFSNLLDAKQFDGMTTFQISKLVFDELNKDSILALEKEREEWLEKIQENPNELKNVPLQLVTEDFCIAAVKHGIFNNYSGPFHYLPDVLKTEAVCHAAVQEFGHRLQYVPEVMKTVAVCLAAVKSFPIALQFVPEALRTKALCFAALQNENFIDDVSPLQFVPMALRTEALCRAAVQQNGCAFQFVPDALRTEALCLEAIKNDFCHYDDSSPLQHIQESLRTEALCIAAVRENRGALQYVPEELQAKVKTACSFP